jgi:hypothetical protein
MPQADVLRNTSEYEAEAFLLCGDTTLEIMLPVRHTTIMNKDRQT